jgi:hypothetical protein
LNTVILNWRESVTYSEEFTLAFGLKSIGDYIVTKVDPCQTISNNNQDHITARDMLTIYRQRIVYNELSKTTLASASCVAMCLQCGFGRALSRRLYRTFWSQWYCVRYAYYGLSV